MSRAIRAAKAFVEFALDDERMDKELKNFGQKLKSVGSRLQSIGTAGAAASGVITAAFAASAKAFADYGGDLDDMSQRTGVSVESLSELGYVAKQSGTTIDSLGNALFRMRRRIANASLETGPAVRALKQLGLNAKDLTQLPVEQQFKIIADALRGVANESEAAQYGFEILGDQFKALSPMVMRGSAEIEELQGQARALGVTMSSETAASAGALGDAIDIVKDQIFAISVEIGAAIAGPLTDFLEWLQGSVSWVIHFIRENHRMVAVVGIVATAVLGLSTALIAIGTAAKGAAAGIAALQFALSAISRHPYLIAATALATAVAAVAAYFWDASDAADEFSGALDRADGKVDRSSTMASARAAEAARMQHHASQLQASFESSAAASGSPVTLDQAAIQGIDRVLGDKMHDVAQHTYDTVVRLERIYQLMLGGRGGLVAGVG